MRRCDSLNQSGRSKKFDKKYFLSAALPFTMCRKYLMPLHSNYNIFCSVEKIFLISFPFRVRVLYLGPGCGSMNNSLFLPRWSLSQMSVSPKRKRGLRLRCSVYKYGQWYNKAKAIFVLRNFEWFRAVEMNRSVDKETPWISECDVDKECRSGHELSHLILTPQSAAHSQLSTHDNRLNISTPRRENYKVRTPTLR